VNILALDTATQICSVALSSENENWYFEIDAGNRHSELLIQVMDMLMKIAGLEPKDLDLVTCMKGPGSFTGLRIAFSAGKGIGLSLGIPLLAIPTLDCMVLGSQAWTGIVIPVIDAKKNSYFTAYYKGGKRLTDYMDANLNTIISFLEKQGEEPFLLTGPSAEMLKSDLSVLGMELQNRIFIDPNYKKGRARELLEITKMEIAEKGGLENCTNEIFSGPLYIRKSDAEIQQSKGG